MLYTRDLFPLHPLTQQPNHGPRGASRAPAAGHPDVGRVHRLSAAVDVSSWRLLRCPGELYSTNIYFIP